MSDPVRELLDRLDGDVGRMPGADVASVRRAGDRRRHRQHALVAAGSAVAVVAIGLIPLGINGFSGPQKAPAASSGPSTLPSTVPSTEPSVSGSPSAAQTLRFLTPAQLPGPATSGAKWQGVAEQSSSGVPGACVDPTGPGASVVSAQWFATSAHPKPGEEIAVQRVLAFDSVDKASAAVTSMIASAKACSYYADPVRTPKAGDEAKTLYYDYHDGAAGAASMQSLVVVRVGTRLSVLTVAMDGNGDIPYIDDLEQKMPTTLADQLSASSPSSS